MDSSQNWVSKIPVNTLATFLKELANNPPTILIAEDDEDICSHLVFEFDKMGFKTLHAYNGLDALKIFDQKLNEIDVIISDVRMPFKGGLSLFDAIAESGLKPVFVLMTGYAYNIPAYQDKIDAYFSKPVNFQTLTNWVVEKLYLRKNGEDRKSA